MSFLDTIPAEIDAELAEHFRDGVLRVGTLTPDGEGGFSTVFVDVPVKALRVDYDLGYRLRSGIPETDVSIIVLRHGMAALPNTSSQVELQGALYAVISVASDPADATWTIQARPV